MIETIILSVCAFIGGVAVGVLSYSAMKLKRISIDNGEICMWEGFVDQSHIYVASDAGDSVMFDKKGKITDIIIKDVEERQSTKCDKCR